MAVSYQHDYFLAEDELDVCTTSLIGLDQSVLILIWSIDVAPDTWPTLQCNSRALQGLSNPPPPPQPGNHVALHL